MSSWSADIWIQLGLLAVGVLGLLGSAAWGLIKFFKWLRLLRPNLKAELHPHIFTDLATGNALGNGIRVRIVHRRGPPIKVQHVYLRVKGVDLTRFFNEGWSGGIGATPIDNIASEDTWLAVRLYRLKGHLMWQPERDAVTEFNLRHEESYFTAYPIIPDVMNQWFLNSESQLVEIVASGPDGEMVLMRGLEVQSLLESLTTHYAGHPLNAGFPFRFSAHTVSRTPPNVSKIGMFNDRGVTIPPPPARPRSAHDE